MKLKKKLIWHIVVIPAQALNTPFGTYNYRDFGRVSFKAKSLLFDDSIGWIEDKRAYVSDSPDLNLSCADKCFSKAGCTAWWYTLEWVNNELKRSCELIIGPTQYHPSPPDTSTWAETGLRVMKSGRLDDLCPTITIKNEFYEESVRAGI